MGPESVVTSIGELAKGSQHLAVQASAAYGPVVEAILSSQSRDCHHIEQTMDGLLGFCFDPSALLLYKKLCRYYYAIDPSGTASYVYAYREMWDSAENEPS